MTTPAAGTTTTAATTGARSFKRLTFDEMAKRKCLGLCFNCDEQFSRGHKCKQLFEITIVNDFDDDDEPSLMVITAGPNGGLQGWCTMRLVGAVFGEGARVVIDTGATHNVVDFSFARHV